MVRGILRGVFTVQINQSKFKSRHNATYEKSEKEEYDDGGITVRPEPPSYGDGNTLPTAPSLPTYKSTLPSTEQYMISAKLRAATARGAISADEEAVSVARDQRNIKKTVDEEVRAANVKASRKVGRPDEGLTVGEDVHHLKSDSGEHKNEGRKEEDVRLYGKKQGEGGYEVNEYDIFEYETFDYDVKEYKSVYYLINANGE